MKPLNRIGRLLDETRALVNRQKRMGRRCRGLPWEKLLPLVEAAVPPGSEGG